MTDDKSPIPDTPTDPPTEPPTPPPGPPTPPTPDEPPTPPAPKSEAVPEWGKDLSAKVDNLSGMLDRLMPASPPEPGDGQRVDDDATPIKPPFHKRSLGSFFGFESS